MPRPSSLALLNRGKIKGLGLVIWSFPGLTGSFLHLWWYFSLLLSIFFFLNKSNYERFKAPFFHNISALRSQQRIGGKECLLSPRLLAFI